MNKPNEIEKFRLCEVMELDDNLLIINWLKQKKLIPSSIFCEICK